MTITCIPAERAEMKRTVDLAKGEVDLAKEDVDRMESMSAFCTAAFDIIDLSLVKYWSPFITVLETKLWSTTNVKTVISEDQTSGYYLL